MEKVPQSPSGSISSIPLYEGHPILSVLLCFTYIASLRPRIWDHDLLYSTSLRGQLSDSNPYSGVELRP